MISIDSEVLHNVKSKICSIVNKKDKSVTLKLDIFSKHIGRKNGKHENHILELKKHNCIMQKILNTCKTRHVFMVTIKLVLMG